MKTAKIVKDLRSKEFSFIRLSAIGAAAMLTLSACSNTGIADQTQISDESLVAKSEALTQREVELAKREAELADRERSMQTAAIPAGVPDAELLPPKAAPGECYARVWVEPTYQTRQEQVVVKEASEKIEVIPAAYEMVQETVLKKPASTKLVTIPAQYETVTEQKLVKAGGMYWKTALRDGAPTDNELLAFAKNHGADIDNASPGTCFHEHYIAARFDTVQEQVMVKEASEKIVPLEPEYRWVEKSVLVSEASKRLETVPAKYETVTEKVLDKPEHTVWKKGSGPIQKIDEATGEIMCLVTVPASYRTVTKRVLVSPAQTREIEIPAEYETVRVRELVRDASEERIAVPAEYKTINITKKVSDPSFVWHEVHDNTMGKDSRTGRQICLTEESDQYETITRRVVRAPARVEKQEIPAEYTTVEVQKVAREAQQTTTVIPASYKTVDIREIAEPGRMEWRSILCETNMTRARISDVQRALADRGYDPGDIDGVIGWQTMQAVNKFQRDNSLPVDKYLNIDTLKALNVSAL